MDSFVLSLEIVGYTAYKFRIQLIHPLPVGVFENNVGLKAVTLLADIL